MLATRQIKAAPWRKRTIQVLSVLTPVDQIVKELNAFQPALLSGYPTVFLLLAGEQTAGRLAINPVLLVSVGEPLEPAMRAEIETAQPMV